MQNTEKGMYVGLKQPLGDGQRYVTPTNENSNFYRRGRRRPSAMDFALHGRSVFTVLTSLSLGRYD